MIDGRTEVQRGKWDLSRVTQGKGDRTSHSGLRKLALLGTPHLSHMVGPQEKFEEEDILLHFSLRWKEYLLQVPGRHSS